MKRFQLLLLGTMVALAARSQNIVAYEYWFDQQDADGQRFSISVSAGATLSIPNATFTHPTLSLGGHQIHWRLKDSNGAWSSVVTRHFENGPVAPYEIIAVRYWVGTPANDSDPLIRYKYFDTPQTALAYNDLLDLCGFPTSPTPQTLKLQLLDNHDQWSSVVTRSVTINPAGSLGAPSITASSASFCPGQVVTFTATPQTGTGFATPTGYSWQVPTGNGWSAQPSTGDTIVVTIGSVSGNVQAAATNYCGSGPLGSIPVTIPDAPDQVAFIIGPLQACIGSSVTYSVPATPPGITFIWQITGGWSASGGPGGSIPTTIGSSDATISVIAQNVCGVQAPPRIANITVTAPPDAGANGTLAICSDADSVNLFTYLQGSPDAGGVWRLNGVLVSSTYNPAINSPGVYTYTVSGSGPCADATASVTVTEPQAPDAGTDGTLTLCSNAQPQPMVNVLVGSPDGGGSWSGPSNTTGVFNPATMLGGLYTYTVSGVAPCSNASATLTITVQQAPNAGVGGTLELCEGSSPLALINSLGGSPALNGTWSGPSGLFAGIFTPGQDAEGTYTYTVQGGGACANASATLQVNVMQLQITGINGPTWAPNVVQLTYNALPTLGDADSILWTLPPGWTWNNDNDHFDTTALVLPSSPAGPVQICAQAVGGGCDGNVFCFDVTVTVGVEEITDGSAALLVYPNPNDGRFTVQMPSVSEAMLVKVTDALGREVSSSVHRGGSISFDLSAHPAGTYVLQWNTPTRWGMSRIVVAR